MNKFDLLEQMREHIGADELLERMVEKLSDEDAVELFEQIADDINLEL